MPGTGRRVLRIAVPIALDKSPDRERLDDRSIDSTISREARVRRKANGRTTGLTPAAQRDEGIDASRVAVAPHHSQAITADEMSISDRKPGQLTTGEQGLLATVASRATCRARARST